MTKTVLSSVVDRYDDTWNAHVDTVRAAGRRGVVRFLAEVARRSRSYRAFVFRGTTTWREGYRELLAALLVRRLRPAAAVVVSDATIEPVRRSVGDRAPSWAASLLTLAFRTLVRAVDGPNVTWCVLSTDEVRTFADTWGAHRGRVVFTPFHHVLWGEHREPIEPSSGRLFAGGNSLRDYQLLVDALGDTDLECDVATTWRPLASAEHLAFGPLSHDDFMRRMRACRAVVVPIEVSCRSAGQQTYLNAMRLGKPVVVTEAPGVRDYIEHGVNGYVSGRTPEQLRETVRRALDDPRAGEVARRARRDAEERWSGRAYRRRLLGLAGALTEPARPVGGATG